MKTIKTLGLTLAAGVLSANLFAAVGPNYQRPTAPTTGQFADAELGSWKEATPADTISRGN